MIDLAALLRFPCDRDKHPLITAWQKNAGRRDHSRWPLVGVPTGAVNGFDVLDVDLEALGWHDQNRDRFPFTQVHTTRSGGWHFLFKHREGLRNSASRIAPGVDVRADGGFIIWWPREGLPFTTAEFAEWPEWLLAMARGDGSVLKRPYGGSAPSTHHGKPYRRTFNPKARIATLMHRLENARLKMINLERAEKWALLKSLEKSVVENDRKLDAQEAEIRSKTAEIAKLNAERQKVLERFQ
jgi:hypothetical protein